MTGDATPGAASPLAAVVLSAGSSSRMGRPKALIRPEGGTGTWLARLVEALRGGGAAVVVVVHGDARVARAAVRAGAVPVENPDAPSTGPGDSLVLGMRALAAKGEFDAVFFTPVDVPPPRPVTLAALAVALAAAPGAIAAVPFHQGRGGHPVLARPALARWIAAEDPPRADRALSAAGERVLRVDVDDPAVVANLNTPEDAARWFGDHGGGGG